MGFVSSGQQKTPYGYELCGSNIQSQRRLYDHMTELVHSMEINHSDNANVVSKRNHEYLDKNDSSGNKNTTIVSSNKVVNTYSRSTKRSKHNYEK